MPTLTPLAPTVSNQEFVPRTGVKAAGSDIFENKLLAGDANPAFQIKGGGIMEWGAGGASAPDVNLYRLGVDALATDDHIAVFRALTTSSAFSARQDADGNARFIVRAGGTLEWGDGTAASDIHIDRLLPNILRIQDELTFQIGAGTYSVSVQRAADTQRRFRLDDSGKMEWGSGTGVPDSNLYRFGGGHLATDSIFSSIGSTPADTAFAVRDDGDTISRWFIRADGQMQWSAGSGSMDTFLLRTGAGLLQMQDQLQVLVPTTTSQGLLVIVSGDSTSRLAVRGDAQIEFGDGGAGGRDVVLQRAGANILQLATGDALNLGAATGTGTYLQFFEQTAQPAAPATNAVRLFAEDNGASKTRLVARFATGTAVTIATEP